MGTLRILQFPDELIILICQNLSIDALLNFRLTHRRFASLIIRYNSSIVPSVARTTFPQAKLLIEDIPGLAPRQRDFEYLKDLVYKYLAAVLVDRYRFSSDQDFLDPVWIPTESPCGHALRYGVENGWRIFKRLGDVLRGDRWHPAVTTTSVDKGSRVRRASQWLSRKLHSTTQTSSSADEDNTMASRLHVFLSELSDRDSWDYALTMKLLSGAFKTKHDESSLRRRPTHRVNYTGPDDFDWDVQKQVSLELHNSWVTWALLYLGPYIWFRQWLPGAVDRQNHVKDTLVTMWNNTPAKERLAKQQLMNVPASVKLGERIGQVVWRPDVVAEFQRYLRWEMGLEKFLTERMKPQDRPVDWMDSVNFFVDFKEGKAN